MPRFTISAGLHVLLALVLALFWFVPKEEEVELLCRFELHRPGPIHHERERGAADDHPPIVPDVFQPDPRIVNDALEVVENTTPMNVCGSKAEGDSLDFISYAALRGKGTYTVVGAAGGAGGRYGAVRASFG